MFWTTENVLDDHTNLTCIRAFGHGLEAFPQSTTTFPGMCRASKPFRNIGAGIFLLDIAQSGRNCSVRRQRDGARIMFGDFAPHSPHVMCDDNSILLTRFRRRRAPVRTESSFKTRTQGSLCLAHKLKPSRSIGALSVPLRGIIYCVLHIKRTSTPPASYSAQSIER